MAQQRKQILFVDDDEPFLELLRDIMAGYAGEGWKIHTAPDVGRALEILQEQRIDLLVIDVHMPVIDGLQFLGLLRRTFPNLLRAVLTGDASETYRAACLNAGAELFLEKPITQEGWQGIHTALNELVKFQPAAGFSGVLRTVGLQDILQMECLARNSSVLEITTRTFQGRIFIERGQIIHAEAGECKGEDAFNHLLTLTGGEFNVQPFAQPAERTISGSWEFLLMEAARKRDEALGELIEESAPAPFSESPIVSAPPVEPAVASPAKGRDEPTPGPPPPNRPVPAETRPRIDEILVASPQGDVLYEWQCQHATERIRFLEFVSQRARQLSQGLPLGDFDRLEMEGAETRAVTQVQPDRTVFARRSQVPRGEVS